MLSEIVFFSRAYKWHPLAITVFEKNLPKLEGALTHNTELLSFPLKHNGHTFEHFRIDQTICINLKQIFKL